jgi:hypothetical protein
MRDYKAKWNSGRHIDPETVLKIDKHCKWGSYLLMALLVAILMRSCVDAVVVEQENREAYRKNERPKAYRKQSPTHEQMWAMDHLLAVQEVAKAGGKQ